MNMDCMEFNGKKRRLIYHGDCLDVLTVCEAACCREWAVNISDEEFETGLYEVEQFCIFSKKECTNQTIVCANRKFRVKKDSQGVCIYLSEDNKCLIYEKRPQICRDFTCKAGWRLEAIFVEKAQTKSYSPQLEKKDILAQLTEDMVFVVHLLVKVRTIFYVKVKEQITIILEVAGRCFTSKIQDSFHCPQLNDELLMNLVRVFDRKDCLKDLRQYFCDHYKVNLTKDEFYEVLWLLNKHGIVTDVRNFRGMMIRTAKDR
jgi:hypothetical protein